MKKNEVSLNIGKKADIRQYFPDRYNCGGCSYYCSVGAQRDNGSCRVIPGCYVLNYAHKRNAIEGQNNVTTTSIDHYCLDLHYHHAHGIKAAAAPVGGHSCFTVSLCKMLPQWLLLLVYLAFTDVRISGITMFI